MTRPQYQISEIFLPAENEQQFNEMEQGAMRLLQEMQRGAPFPLVARQFSQSPSAAAGGDLGWIASNELMPELQPVAEQLQSGQVSLPVRTPNGVYIIAMRDRRAGGQPGSASVIQLQQVSAPAARRAELERLRRRNPSCGNLQETTTSIADAVVVDLGQTAESDLAAGIRERIASVQAGQTSEVRVEGDRADMLVVCSRQTGGAGVPDRNEIENRLREAEMTMLSDRYLRNLRREATIITRQ
jgi:peptidyl-prolyl cis-trans isomerase SurA